MAQQPAGGGRRWWQRRPHRPSRRAFLRGGVVIAVVGVLVVGGLMAGGVIPTARSSQPQIIEKVVTQTVEVEKIVTKEVPVDRVVTKEVERVVTKEVIKEVPVERIVTQVVEKVVTKEVTAPAAATPVATPAALPSPTPSAPTPAPTVVASGEVGRVQVTSAECMDTKDAQAILRVDVMRVSSEFCGWAWRGRGVGTTSVNLVDGWILTMDLADGPIVVAEQPGVYQVWAFTARWKPGYPVGETVHDKCQQVRVEDKNGQEDVHPFHVVPFRFTCPTR